MCTENLCRSPVAEGLLRMHLGQVGLGGHVRVESAGTRVSRPGSRPDQRAQRIAASAGVDIGRCRARRIAAADFERCDLILAMDKGNLRDLLAQCPESQCEKVRLLLEVHPESELADVPDPYYGSIEGFRRVHEILDVATLAWAQQMAASGVDPAGFTP
ncbi:MAG: low molecular weight protein-tyrosine-phosphatase [Halioglobus sp.]